MANWVYLSYIINEKTPLYGGQKTFQFKRDKKIETGDSCNTMQWSMPNHIGTHIDFPRHFNEKGKTIDNYKADFWVINNISLIEIEKIKPAQLIFPDDLVLDSIQKSTELLLIKTGYSELRYERAYWENNPGFHPDVAEYLRERLKKLKIVGFDTISLSSYANRDIGRNAHRAFLDNTRPILLIEDMKLGIVNNKTKLNRVFINPMRISGADATPCTILAEVT